MLNCPLGKRHRVFGFLVRNARFGKRGEHLLQNLSPVNPRDPITVLGLLVDFRVLGGKPGVMEPCRGSRANSAFARLGSYSAPRPRFANRLEWP